MASFLLVSMLGGSHPKLGRAAIQPPEPVAVQSFGLDDSLTEPGG